MKDIVFEIISSMLAHSPEASYKRLNPALRCCLSDCISADLPFQPDTFQKLADKCRGHWWMGDGAGSHLGEHYYGQAIQLNHVTAYQSFEKWAGRPGVLWEDDAGSAPARLYVGKEFSWKGYYVSVTSMRKDSLVACTYHKSRNRAEGVQVGAEIGYGKNMRVVTSSKKDGKAHILRVIPAREGNGESSVARRFTIKYSEIQEFRRSEAKRVKAMCEKIAKLEPGEDSAKLSVEISKSNFRHFQLEIIRAAFTKHQKFLSETQERERHKERIEAWRKGKGGGFLEVEATMLRVKDDLVECSNGNSISRSTAARVLPILLDRRGDHSTLSIPVDGYTVNRISPEGVQIGCTFVSWPEIDLIAPMLQEQPDHAVAA